MTHRSTHPPRPRAVTLSPRAVRFSAPVTAAFVPRGIRPEGLLPSTDEILAIGRAGGIVMPLKAIARAENVTSRAENTIARLQT